MIELDVDLWSEPADAKCITTNGFIKKSGAGVMGAGVAGQAQERYPWLPQRLGSLLRREGNHVAILEAPHSGAMFKNPVDTYLVMFPVKHKWFEDADLWLIRRSAYELEQLTDHMGWKRVLLPKPGCGNGGLKWEDVRPELTRLDDRFVIIDRPLRL